MAKFWYSRKQANVIHSEMYQALRAFGRMHGAESVETRAFVTVPLEGELLEMEYTEMYSGTERSSDGEFPIRIEVIEP